MINDQFLENRLNAVKNGHQIPVPEKPETYLITGKKENLSKIQLQSELKGIISYSLKQRLITEVLTLFNILIVAVLYGFGMRGILAMDWNFLETMGIGLIMSHIISRYIPKIYKWIMKLSTKKSI